MYKSQVGVLVATVCCWKCGAEALAGHDGPEEVSRRHSMMICCTAWRSLHICVEKAQRSICGMAMEMRARSGVAALAPMDEDALGGPGTVEQSRAVLHVVAQATQIADEVHARTAGPQVARSKAPSDAVRNLYFRCGRYGIKVPALYSYLAPLRNFLAPVTTTNSTCMQSGF